MSEASLFLGIYNVCELSYNENVKQTVRGGEKMDNFAYLVMQILTVVLLVGTLGLSFFVGKIMKKNSGY